MSSYSERLVEAMLVKPLNQTELAEIVGVKPQAIQHLCSKGKGSRHNQRIAEACGVNPEWLAYNLGSKLPSHAPVKEPETNYIGTELAKGKIASKDGGVNALEIRKVPIMNHKQLIDGVRAETLNVENHKNWQPQHDIEVDQHTFAVIMEGSSMTNHGHEKHIPAGAAIYIDPNEAPLNNDTVLVKDLAGNILVKTLEIDGPNKYLVSANPQHTTMPMTDDHTILGVGIGYGTFNKFRRK